MSGREDVSNRYLASGFGNSGVESTLARMLGKDVAEKAQYCAHCGEACSPGYSLEKDSSTVYCKTHYEQLFASKCEGCNRPIVGEFVNSSGKKYHVTCAPEGGRCERCRQPIFGQSKNTSTKTYHPKCFTCSSCNKVLDSFVDIRGSPFCSNCGNEVTLSRAAIPGVTYENSADREQREKAQIQNELFQNVQAGKELCTWCRKAVRDDAIAFTNKYFHSDCFMCGNCGETIGRGTFTDVGGLAHCERCAPKQSQSSSSASCAGCHQALSGTYVTALNAKYHSQCFKCSKCAVVLKGGYAAKAGKPVCANCASAPAGGPAKPAPADQGERRAGFKIDPRSGTLEKKNRKEKKRKEKKRKKGEEKKRRESVNSH